MSTPRRMPRKSEITPGNTEEEVVELEETSSQPTASESTNTDDLGLSNGFGPPPSNADDETRRPKGDGGSKRDGGKQTRRNEPTPDPTPAQPRKRMKPPTMHGRANEDARKLAAAILRFWYASLQGDAPKDGETDNRAVVWAFDAGKIAELIKTPQDAKQNGRHPLETDVEAHFTALTGQWKWKVNTPTTKVARTDAEMVALIRAEIAKSLGCATASEVTVAMLTAALAKAGVNVASQEPTNPTTTTSPTPSTSSGDTGLSTGMGLLLGLVAIAIAIVLVGMAALR